MKRRSIALALVLVLLTGSVMVPAYANAAQGGNPLKNIALTGTAAGQQVFKGTFDVTQFTHKGNQILASGTLKGTLTKADNTTGNVNQQVALPVNITSGTCKILNLTLGPLDLNLLGLRVQLNQVNLQITAEQGSGNLLGNLLCAVAKLLDNPGGNVGRLVGLLNDILKALG